MARHGISWASGAQRSGALLRVMARHGEIQELFLGFSIGKLIKFECLNQDITWILFDVLTAADFAGEVLQLRSCIVFATATKLWMPPAKSTTDWKLDRKERQILLPGRRTYIFNVITSPIVFDLDHCLAELKVADSFSSAAAFLSFFMVPMNTKVLGKKTF